MIFKEMHQAVDPLIHAIHNLKFNQELAKGMLAKDKFIYYIIQDSLYLSDYAKALSLTAARLPDNTQAQQFMRFALEAINAERDLHYGYLTENLSEQSSSEQNPVCFMYTNFLLKTASLASVEEAVAGLLPCFWVYREVGKKIAATQSENNPYKDWIALYASEEFDTSVNTAIDITNRLGFAASKRIQHKMIAAFQRSTQLEWMFWDSAYHQEKWLI